MRKCLANDRGKMKLIFVFLITLAVLAATVAGVTYLAYRNAEKEYYDDLDTTGQYERYPFKILYPEIAEPETVHRYMDANPEDPEEREVYKKVQQLLFGRELTDQEKKETFYASQYGLFSGYTLSSLDVFVKLPDGTFPWKEDELRLFFAVNVNQNVSDLPEEESISYPRMLFMLHLDDPEIVAKNQEYQKKAVYTADMTYPGISMEMKQYYPILHSFYLDGNKIIPEEVWFVESRSYTEADDFASEGISENTTKVVEKIKRNVPNSDTMVRISSTLKEDAPRGVTVIHYDTEKALESLEIHIIGMPLYNTENTFHVEEKEKYIKKAEEIATEEGAVYYTKEDVSDMRVNIISRKRNIPELGGDVLAVVLAKEPGFTNSYFLHSNSGFLGKILPGFLASDDCATSDSYYGFDTIKARKNETSILLLFGCAVVISAGVTWVASVRRKKKNND